MDSDKLEGRERQLERASVLCEFSVSTGVNTGGRGVVGSWKGRAEQWRGHTREEGQVHTKGSRGRALEEGGQENTREGRGSAVEYSGVQRRAVEGRTQEGGGGLRHTREGGLGHTREKPGAYKGEVRGTQERVVRGTQERAVECSRELWRAVEGCGEQWSAVFYQRAVFTTARSL